MLDPDKAVALGVKPGRAFAQLKAGQAVETAAGRTVQPSEVRAVLKTRGAHFSSRRGGAADLRPAVPTPQTAVCIHPTGAGRQPSGAAIAGARREPAAGSTSHSRKLQHCCGARLLQGTYVLLLCKHATVWDQQQCRIEILPCLA